MICRGIRCALFVDVPRCCGQLLCNGLRTSLPTMKRAFLATAYGLQNTPAVIGMPLLTVLRLHRFSAKHCTRSHCTQISTDGVLLVLMLQLAREAR